MKATRVLMALLAALALAGCVAHTRPENAALRMPWPPESPPALLAYAPRDQDFPSVGGDILKGASPADLEAARAAARSAGGVDFGP
jgi:hypothetical protein